MKKAAMGFTPIQIATAMGIAMLGVGLLTRSAAVGQGIRDGLTVCGKVLIPSLFPFMVFSGFIALTHYSSILSWPLRAITAKVYKLPPDFGVVVLLSLIGGFPVGAKTIGLLLEQKRISKETAQRMLCFCVNAGPSFLISAVGAGMFFNQRLGIILFATQTTATLVIGAVASLGAGSSGAITGKPISMPVRAAFVTAVTNAASAMITICSFAILFSGILALVRELGVVEGLASVLPLSREIINAILSGLFEVTAGCLASAQIGGDAAILMVSACVSFCSLSILFQIMSCFKDNSLKFGRFILLRVAHGFLSGAMALPLYKLLCKDQVVWIPQNPPLMHADNRTLVISICLLAMCSILVLSMEKYKE